VNSTHGGVAGSLGRHSGRLAGLSRRLLDHASSLLLLPDAFERFTLLVQLCNGRHGRTKPRFESDINRASAGEWNPD